MVRILKGYVVSWVRLGYPLFPVADGAWLHEKVAPTRGSVVIANTSFFPLARLHLIPHRLEGEFRRRMRKARVSQGLSRTVVAVMLLASALGDSDASLVVSALAIALFLGIMPALWVYASRLRRYIRSEMILVHPTAAFAWRFRLFYLGICAVLFLYGFLKGLVDGLLEREGGKGAASAGDESRGLLEQSVSEAVTSPLHPLRALALALLKAVGGLLITLLGAGAFLVLGEALGRSPGLALWSIGLTLAAGCGWSYWYYIHSERARQGPAQERGDLIPRRTQVPG